MKYVSETAWDGEKTRGIWCMKTGTGNVKSSFLKTRRQGNISGQDPSLEKQRMGWWVKEKIIDRDIAEIPGSKSLGL